MQHQLRAEKHDFLPQANLGSFHMPLLLHIPSRVLPQLGSLSQTSGHSALRFAGSPFTTSQLPAVSDKSLCKVKKWYWDEMTHFCYRDGWVFKYACLLLALLVSICGHSSLHPPAQTFMVRGLLWPVQRHASFPFLSAVQGNTSK